MVPLILPLSWLRCTRLPYWSAAVQKSLKVPAVTGVHRASPAANAYRGTALVAPTRETVAGMGDAISVMVRQAMKLANGETLDPANQEGYLPTGRRENMLSEKTAAERAVEMLMRKLRG